MGKWKHRISDVLEIKKTAYCAECADRVRVYYNPSHKRWACSEIIKQRNRMNSHKYRYPENDRKAQLKKYGLTIDDFNKMAKAQNWLCLICSKKKKLSVDHDHNTGKVRGLLCIKCNFAIGLLEDDINLLNKALVYLR